MVAALVPVDGRVRVQADYEVVTLPLGDLEEVQVADVEEIERACHVNDLVARLRALAVAELYDLLRGRQELRAAGPWTPRASVLAHAFARFPVDAVLIVALAKVLPRHQQHPSNQVGRRNASCPLNFSAIGGNLLKTICAAYIFIPL